ncbi:MAG: antitoxin family protein [Methanospirillaceae archaeon]|nr:antitoxin family protein [Methanospirillaceae archaeon]
MLIRAKVEGNAIHPLDPVPFKDGDIITITIETGLYSLSQELGSIPASHDIDLVFHEMRTRKYYE